MLTTEVFQALDFLPREAFLGRVLRAASGADDARENAAAEVENALVDVLPGDLVHSALQMRVQPDVVISSLHSYVLVEAKRILTSSFQEEQLARELLSAEHHAEGRPWLLLVVLGVPPPVTVRGHGALSIVDAVRLGQERISARVGHQIPVPDPGTSVASLAWADIATEVTGAVGSYDGPDGSTQRSVKRVASSITEAVRVHG